MFSRRITLPAATVAVAGLAAVAAPAASAAPVVTEATGSNAEIQAAVDAYRNSLGTNNAGGPPQPAGRREINWDGVPDDRSAPSFMPEGQFRARGALFSTPGTGVQVSADDNDDNGSPDADADLIEFTSVNATYDEQFAAFSPERLFAPIGSNVTDTEFVIPASDTPAQTNGFGVVFTDVDQDGPTTIELLDAKGGSLGEFAAPASPGSEEQSFLGIKLDPGVGASTARITTGTAALGPDDGASDIVVMDDFIYGEPQPIPPDEPEPPAPEPEPDAKAPQVTLDVAKELGPKAFAKGVKVSLTTDEPTTVDASLRTRARGLDYSPARARATVLLAERSLGLGQGERQLTLKAKRGVLRGVESLKAEVRVKVTDAAGNATTVKRKLRVS